MLSKRAGNGGSPVKYYNRSSPLSCGLNKNILDLVGLTGAFTVKRKDVSVFDPYMQSGLYANLGGTAWNLHSSSFI